MDQQTDNRLVPVDDVVARIQQVLDGLWNALSEARPDLVNQLATVSGDLDVLVVAARDMLDMLAGTLAVADELREQRDAALEKLAWRHKDAHVLRDMAKAIAHDSGIPFQDVERTLEVLGGFNDLWVSDYTKDDLFEALRTMAREAAEEAAYQAEIADTEEEED